MTKFNSCPTKRGCGGEVTWLGGTIPVGESVDRSMRCPEDPERLSRPVGAKQKPSTSFSGPLNT